MEKVCLVPYQNIVNFNTDEKLVVVARSKGAKVTVNVTESTIDSFHCVYAAKYKTPSFTFRLNQFEKEEKPTFITNFKIFNNSFLNISLGLGLEAKANGSRNIKIHGRDVKISTKSSVDIKSLFDFKKSITIKSVNSFTCGNLRINSSYFLDSCKEVEKLEIMPHIMNEKLIPSLYIAPLEKKYGVCASTSVNKIPLFMSLCYSPKGFETKAGMMMTKERSSLRFYASNKGELKAMVSACLSEHVKVNAFCTTLFKDTEETKYGFALEFKD